MNKIFMPVACVAISLMVSCTKDQTNESIHQLDSKISLLESDFGRALVEKVGKEKANGILQQVNNQQRTPITYEGQLCPDEVNTGDAVLGGYSDLANADFWSFYGNAGDVVNISVSRVNCNMDPAFILYDGYGDTDSLTLLTGADDNDPPACEPGCSSFGDPSISGFVLPSTGYYTVAVWDFLSGACATGTMDYSIVASGSGIVCDTDGDGCNDDVDPHPNSNEDPTVTIDGCDSGVDNVFINDCSTMNDLISDCAAAAANHDEFVDCVAQLTNAWVASGLITGKQKGKIQSCAGQSGIPY